MDFILAELSAQEEIQIQYTKSKYQFSSGRTNNKQPPRKQSSSKPNKTCSLCKAANQQYTGHNINDCWFLSKFEKMEIAKAFQVTVDYESDRDDDNESSDIKLFESSMSVTSEPKIDCLETKIQKVECDTSPFFFAFYKHHPCHIVIETGVTSSVVSQAFVKRSGIDIKNWYSARSADKSNLPVLGEVHFTLNFGNLDLPITALVIERLDCDIFAGIPFCKKNDIHVHLKAETISIGNFTIPYGNRGRDASNNQRQIRRINATLLRNDSEKIVMPGEYIEFKSPTLQKLDCEVPIEPHTPAHDRSDRIHPSISRVINSVVRIPNMTNEPIQISKLQHLAHIHPIIVPEETPIQQDNSIQTPSTQPQPASIETISVDPDALLTTQQRQQFCDINARYQSVYQPNFGAYNDRSGPIRADINLGLSNLLPKKVISHFTIKRTSKFYKRKPTNLNV